MKKAALIRAVATIALAALTVVDQWATIRNILKGQPDEDRPEGAT